MTDIKTLAPYLGYGLMVQHGGEEYEMIGINTTFKDGHITLKKHYGGGVFSFPKMPVPTAEVKPIFRPFRALVEETELGGNVIVPAVEVAKLAHGMFAGGSYVVSGISKEIDGSKCIRITSDNRLVDDVVIHSCWTVVHEHEITCNHYLIHQLLRRLHFAPPGLPETEYIAIGEA